jgi:hypothetical protein
MPGPKRLARRDPLWYANALLLALVLRMHWTYAAARQLEEERREHRSTLERAAQLAASYNPAAAVAEAAESAVEAAGSVLSSLLDADVAWTVGSFLLQAAAVASAFVIAVLVRRHFLPKRAALRTQREARGKSPSRQRATSPDKERQPATANSRSHSLPTLTDSEDAAASPRDGGQRQQPPQGGTSPSSRGLLGSVPAPSVPSRADWDTVSDESGTRSPQALRSPRELMIGRTGAAGEDGRLFSSGSVPTAVTPARGELLRSPESVSAPAYATWSGDLSLDPPTTLTSREFETLRAELHAQLFGGGLTETSMRSLHAGHAGAGTSVAAAASAASSSHGTAATNGPRPRGSSAGSSSGPSPAKAGLPSLLDGLRAAEATCGAAAADVDLEAIYASYCPSR